MSIAAASDFSRIRAVLPDIQAALRDNGLDGWLLYDLHARNGVSASLLGLGDLTRRYFVLLPAEGTPIAVTHGIEQGPWAAWPWDRVDYVSWKSLDERLLALLAGRPRVAMEYSGRDAVPACDLVPAGIIELVRSAGGDPQFSGDLISRFHSRWTGRQLASHRRAAQVLAETARKMFEAIASDLSAGRKVTEGIVTDRVNAELAAGGCATGADCIVATGLNAANPHYGPINGGATVSVGDVILLDLWAQESPDMTVADQTWMAYMGAEVPPRAAELFGIVCAARDAAIEFLRTAWSEGRQVQGYEVDDVTRGVIRDAGYAEWFIHRTGHSIDTATHGMGPNIDNLETHETRILIPGAAFSIEPGIYIAGELGVRTEINIYMGKSGPEVTPAVIQSGMATFPGI